MCSGGGDCHEDGQAAAGAAGLCTLDSCFAASQYGDLTIGL